MKKRTKNRWEKQKTKSKVAYFHQTYCKYIIYTCDEMQIVYILKLKGRDDQNGEKHVMKTHSKCKNKIM